MNLPPEFEELAHRLLSAADPPVDPIVALRLARDVLHLSENKLKPFKHKALNSPQIQRLVEKQQSDGSWGRFHSQDTRQPFGQPTTEWAVRRLLALGLDKSDEPMKAAIACMEGLLTSDSFPDPPERNDRWPLGTSLFVSATLALADPRHSLLKPHRKTWAAILTEATKGGVFSPECEKEAHIQMTGLLIDGTYLAWPNRYHLELLGQCPGMNKETGRRLVSDLIKNQRIIGYLGSTLQPPHEPVTARSANRWMRAWELVLDWPMDEEASHIPVSWLRAHSYEDGWDFGPLKGNETLPYTGNWRTARRRKDDWTLRALLLLSRLGT